jgi:LPS-assembly protein
MLGIVLASAREAQAAIRETLDLKQAEKVDIEADEFYYDQARDLAVATGHAVANYGQDVISADRIIYYRNKNHLLAIGNITFAKSNGDLGFADVMKLEPDTEEGILINFKVRTKKNVLLAAKTSRIHSQELAELEEVIFSPCKICENNLRPNVPLWQVRADRAIIDAQQEKITYKKARVDLFGTPIFYMPSLSMPMPGVSRRSGFLPPEPHHSQDFGYNVIVPVYLNIAKNKDATISGRFTKRMGNIYFLEYRHKTKRFEYKLNSSFTRAHKIDEKGKEIPKKRVDKGHIDLSGVVHLQDTKAGGYISFNFKDVVDQGSEGGKKTYLKKYKISKEDYLKSDITYRKLYDRGYSALEIVRYRGLRPEDQLATTAQVAPRFYNYHHKPIDFLSSYITMDSNLVNVHKSRGVVYQRGTVRGNWRIPFTLAGGHLLSIDPSLRADLYNVKYKGPHEHTLVKEDEIWRGHPQLSINWNLPLHKHTTSGVWILTPTANLVLSPKAKKIRLSDESTIPPELSAVNLFTENRIRGMDVIESGNRLNFGLRGNYSGELLENIGFVLGQTYRSSKDSSFDKRSGLDQLLSDYVGMVNLDFDKHISINHNWRIDRKNFKLLRNQVSLNADYRKVIMKISYASITRALMLKKEDPTVVASARKYKEVFRQELHTTLDYNFYNDWWVAGHIKLNLGKKPKDKPTRMIKSGGSFQYRGDCLIFKVGVTRDYTKLKDLKPSTDYSIRFIIPKF